MPWRGKALAAFAPRLSMYEHSLSILTMSVWHLPLLGAARYGAHLLCCSGLELCGGDCALRGKICFVPHEHDDHVVPPLRSHIRNPLRGRFERFAVGDVEDDDSNV